jgi:hypothetical protein
MVYHPFRSLGRFALVACAVSLGAASLSAQTPAATTPAAGSNPSRFDVFTGYSYFGAHGNLQPAGLPYSSINAGAIGSGAYYFNKNFGGEIIYTNHPSGTNDGASGISAGPIFRLPTEHYTLFAHGLVGTERLGGPNSNVPAIYEKEPYTWGVALTAGGGIDYALPFFSNRFSFRLAQVDYRYIHDDFGPYVGIPATGGPLGGRTNLNAIELSTGIVTHFGNLLPPTPVTLTATAVPDSIYAGDPVTLTATAVGLQPKLNVIYSWSGSGVTGNTATTTVATANFAPGSYTVKAQVKEGKAGKEGLKPWESAEASTSFTVKPFDPPTISCSASPSSVNPGDSATISASAVSPQNRPLTYSYNATAGSISSTTASATLATTGAAPGPITVTCGVSDDKGHSVSATTSVEVIAPPPPPAPPAPLASSLCPVSFERDAKRPTRVDNEAKACLDDIALNLQRSADAKLALVGNEDAKEQKADAKLAKLKHNKKPTAASARAVNTKDYLVTDKGIDASRILVYTGTDDGKTVTTTLIPAGATNPVASDPAVDETAVKAVPRNPVKMAMKKK